MTKILCADTEELIAKVRGLFLEYAASLGFDLAFQDFEKGMADFPDEYSSPHRRLLLAFYGEELAGCVALRDLGNGICEMKRLVSHVRISAMTRLIKNRYMAVGYRQLIDSSYEMRRDLGNETRNA